jgi:hypothetical protein
MSILLAAALAAPSPIYHYVRSNRDGSEPEHVVHYRPTRTAIAVYKWVEKCTTAAYVTAEMAPDLKEGRRFIAGKVAKDGSQARFGTLSVSNGALVADVTPPGGSRIQARHKLTSRPFIIYDFDFADLNSFLQEHRPRANFAYELPVIWPGDANVFRGLGKLHARYAGKQMHAGRQTVRFDLRVDGPAPSTGALWIDAKRGFIVEAELGLPNHQEYRDFRLKLDRIKPGGAANWNALTKSQYANCPAT